MRNACIFDLDGTLVDSLPSIAYFGNKALIAAALSPYPVEEYKSMIGWGAEHLVREMVCRQGVPKEDTDTFTKVYQKYITDYNNDPTYLLTPYPHMPEIIRQLANSGITVGIFSNKPHETTMMIAKELFPNAVSNCFGSKIGMPKKPDPTVLLSILENNGIEKQNCLYFGDSETDIQTGLAANVRTFGVLWGYRDSETLLNAGALALLNETSEIYSIAQKELAL